MAELKLLGIHHVTAICGDAQQNVDFYTGVLGLRLVKLTVNYDDPSAYHFYYADTVGTPGTVLTFFNYGAGHRGACGAGMFTSMTFAVPVGSLGFWKEHLAAYGAEVTKNTFGEELVTARDPDGLTLHFVESATAHERQWPALGKERSILRIQGVGLGTRTEASAKFASDVLLASPTEEKMQSSGKLARRYQLGESTLDVWPTEHRSLGGPGTVHHVAWRVEDDRHQEFWLAELQKRSQPVSEVRDRQYFHSIYFREPGGALNEIATDGPGFTFDEPVDKLGSALVLPAFLKSHRAEIEAKLPRLRLPAVPV
jgi:glyoxalase family protein